MDSKGTVVFTGFRNKDLEKKLQDDGYEVSESLTKDTSFLLIPIEGHKSSKVEKAKKYGVTIVPVNEFIRNNYHI
jgi:NAD-dependent DNA ligase